MRDVAAAKVAFTSKSRVRRDPQLHRRRVRVLYPKYKGGRAAEIHAAAAPGDQRDPKAFSVQRVSNYP